MVVTALSGKTNFDRVINSGKVVIIDFWASWCGPCKAISPVVEKLAEETSGMEFYKVDVDNEEEISQEVGIKAMPTFVAFKDGEKMDEVVGANPGAIHNMVATFKSLVDPV